MTLAVSRAAWVISIAVLLMAVPVVIDVLGHGVGAAYAAVPLAAVAGILGLLVYVGLQPSGLSRAVTLGAGAVLASVYEVSLLWADPSLNEDATYLLNRPAFVLVLIVAGIARPLVGIAWALLGFLVSMLSLSASSLVAGVEVRPGWGSTIALGILSANYLVVTVIRLSQGSHIPDLAKLEAATRRTALEHQYEQRAAALIHDTVLNDLTVVMNSAGTLDARTRARFLSDVETMKDASWLRESRHEFVDDPADAAFRNGMVSLVSEMQWRGLTVDGTGRPVGEVVRLSARKITALHDAVRAALENVLQHAGTRSAELALGAENDSVTAMIIDQGVGFDPDSVPADRLGIRASITRRVEEYGGEVRIWSRPGAGTTVMITMPCEVLAPRQSGPPDDS